MNHVVCVKWGNKYPPVYANVLNNMVKKHTTVPYQFHCLTDDSTNLDADINVIKLPNDPWIKSWWSKLWMFAPEMPLKGNILFFDLDVVIFDTIDLPVNIIACKEGGYFGYVNKEYLTGVCTQGETIDEVKEGLGDALKCMLKFMNSDTFKNIDNVWGLFLIALCRFISS